MMVTCRVLGSAGRVSERIQVANFTQAAASRANRRRAAMWPEVCAQNKSPPSRLRSIPSIFKVILQQSGFSRYLPLCYSMFWVSSFLGAHQWPFIYCYAFILFLPVNIGNIRLLSTKLALRNSKAVNDLLIPDKTFPHTRESYRQLNKYLS